MESRTCKICNHRRVRQQEWKTPEEKEVCGTCSIYLRYINDEVIPTLQKFADEKKINKRVEMKLI